MLNVRPATPEEIKGVDGGTPMAAHRDPRSIGCDELVAYFNAGGNASEVLRGAIADPDLGPAPKPEPPQRS
jgi:hypothetical protein